MYAIYQEIFGHSYTSCSTLLLWELEFHYFVQIYMYFQFFTGYTSHDYYLWLALLSIQPVALARYQTGSLRTTCTNYRNQCMTFTMVSSQYPQIQSHNNTETHILIVNCDRPEVLQTSGLLTGKFKFKSRLVRKFLMYGHIKYIIKN